MEHSKVDACLFFKLFLMALICCACRPSKAFLGVDVDKLVFNTSLGAIKLAAKGAIYSVMNSPRMIVLLAVIYFHKEIAILLKDYFMYLAGEYPCACFAGGSAGLYYITR